MRDPRRIPEILGLLEQIWSRSPDLRFFQLIYNIQGTISRGNLSYGEVRQPQPHGTDRVGYDFFNREDDQVVRDLKRILEGEGKTS